MTKPDIVEALVAVGDIQRHKALAKRWVPVLILAVLTSFLAGWGWIGHTCGIVALVAAFRIVRHLFLAQELEDLL